MMLMLFAAAVATYDCKLSKPIAVDRNGDAVSARVIRFPGLEEKPWGFELTLGASDATVSWPDSPMQLNGKASILPTAKGAGAFIIAKGGSCLFTEAACGSTVQYAEQSDGTLMLIITPIALATDPKADTRKPFLAMIDGECSVRRVSK